MSNQFRSDGLCYGNSGVETIKTVSIYPWLVI